MLVNILTDILKKDNIHTEESELENFVDNSENSENDLIKLPKATYSYSLICLFVIVIMAILFVVGINLNSAHTTLSASFSEIHNGHNPDGSPFDIYEVINDEVLENACEKLDNKITPEMLKKHISVTGITTDGTFNSIKQNVLDGEETYSYFPSRYTLTYSIVSDSVKTDGVWASLKAVFKQITLPSKAKILTAVAQSYKECYESNYVVTNETFDIDWEKTRSLDYFNRASEMTNILNRISRYLGNRYDKDVKFVSTDGVSFGDLNAEATRIIDNEIKSYEAFIIENGITSDKDKLLKQFKYVVSENREAASRSRGEYSIMLDGISMYDPSITKVVFIPALDTDNNFYMNRTKIGIDYLTENASKANMNGDTAENEAQYYDYLINHFQSTGECEEWVLKTADKRCEEIISKINDFTKKTAAVNEEYLNTVSYEGIETSEIGYGKGIISSVVAIIKLTIICSAICYVLWLAYCILKKINQLRKEGKADVN